MSYKDNFVFWKLWLNNFFGSSDAFNLKLFGDKDRQQAGKNWNCVAAKVITFKSRGGLSLLELPTLYVNFSLFTTQLNFGRFQNCQHAQNQPTIQILFYKNGSPGDLYIMTLVATMLEVRPKSRDMAPMHNQATPIQINPLAQL